MADYIDVADGATNNVVLVAKGNEFQVYINGNDEGHYNDWSKKLSEGRIAFFGSQLSGNVSEVDVDYSSEVKKDQVLARIDPADPPPTMM